MKAFSSPVIAAVAAAMTASPVFAQATSPLCQLVEAMNDENFAGADGIALSESDEGQFNIAMNDVSVAILSNADDCNFEQDDPEDVALDCHWKFDTESEASAFWERLNGEMGACLSFAPEALEPKEKSQITNYERLGGYRYAQPLREGAEMMAQTELLLFRYHGRQKTDYEVQLYMEHW